MTRKLSPRQHRVLWWVARGKSSAEIAEILGIKAHTVDERVNNAKRKLGCDSRVAAIFRAGLATLTDVPEIMGK